MARSLTADYKRHSPLSSPAKLPPGLFSTLREPASAPTLFAEMVAVGQRGTPEDLSISIFDLARNLSGQVTYNAKRFLPATIERMVGHFQSVLQAMIANPTTNSAIASTHRRRTA